MTSNAVSRNGSDLASKQVFTTGEAAKVCGVSQQTIIRCFDAGRVGGFRVPGSRFRRIPRAELIKFMRHNDIPIDVFDAGPKRVLIVEDDPNIVELFEDALGNDRRLELRSASTGYDAGLLTESFKPDLILLDYMLPDVNGDLVLQRIREREDLASTRVILISGVVDQDEIDGLLKAGADAFIQKPFDLDALMRRIEALLEI